MTPPIEVPKEWIEGLVKAINFKFVTDDSMTAAKLSYLIGYIKSAESFLKR